MKESRARITRDHLCADAGPNSPRSPRAGDLEYRIVRDDYLGFEVQRRRRGLFGWRPWSQWRTNSHSTLEEAKAFALADARYSNSNVVAELGNLSAAARAAGQPSAQPPHDEPALGDSSREAP